MHGSMRARTAGSIDDRLLDPSDGPGYDRSKRRLLVKRSGPSSD
jgi:hypothetical protein